jgi:hypothetical protein
MSDVPSGWDELRAVLLLAFRPIRSAMATWARDAEL